MALEALARRFFHTGRLTVIDAGGKVMTFGPAEPGSRSSTVRFTRHGAAMQIAANPVLRLGEAITDGDLVVEEGDLYNFMALVGENFRFDPERQEPPRMKRALQAALHSLTELNDRVTSRRNVHHHYDLSTAFYRLFLDPDLQYSCAYFPQPQASLEEAQALKKRRLALKLALKPGDRVLDIGCGWGGLGLTLAGDFGAQVQGVTLSTEQHAVANQRAAEAGLADRAKFDLIDYRDITGPFDRIVSVGMFEHVGRPNYDGYFKRVADLLTEDGVAVIHSIGRKEGPGVTNPWIAKYIFPGGYIPSLAEVLPAIERAGLWVTDVEIMRLHYAETLKAWRERFLANREAAKAMYDERFCRMWEFYLVTSEVAFRYAGHMVFQLQLAHRQDAVPLTRAYLQPPAA
jgi:cyclopropane-fatty-acyl-phospholipid synthase